MVTPQREFMTGEYYHVYNRGNRKQPIFLRRKDYQRFLDHFVEYREQHPVTVLAYCLMGNHFHFMLRQDEDQAISKLFSKLCTGHAKYFNKKYDQVGSLFQQGFRAKRITEEAHFLHLWRYIHRNRLNSLDSTLRVEPGYLLQNLLEYPWSSLGEYLQPQLMLRSICTTSDFQDFAGDRSLDELRQFLLDEVNRYQDIQEYVSRCDP